MEFEECMTTKRTKNHRNLCVTAPFELIGRLEELARTTSPLLSIHRAHLELLKMAVAAAEADPSDLKRALGFAEPK